MNCQKCKIPLETIMVSVEGYKNKVKSFQCENCQHIIFEKDAFNKLIKIKNHPIHNLKRKVKHNKKEKRIKVPAL